MSYLSVLSKYSKNQVSNYFLITDWKKLNQGIRRHQSWGCTRRTGSRVSLFYWQRSWYISVRRRVRRSWCSRATRSCRSRARRRWWLIRRVPQRRSSASISALATRSAPALSTSRPRDTATSIDTREWSSLRIQIQAFLLKVCEFLLSHFYFVKFIFILFKFRSILSLINLVSIIFKKTSTSKKNKNDQI